MTQICKILLYRHVLFLLFQRLITQTKYQPSDLKKGKYMIHIYYKFNSFYSLCILRSPESVVIHVLVFQSFLPKQVRGSGHRTKPTRPYSKNVLHFQKSSFLHSYIYIINETENEKATVGIFFHNFENLPLFLIACQDILHEAL